MSTEPREKYVARGVDYWLHKKHRDKPEEAKIKYLKSKGLTAAEIELVQKKAIEKKSTKNRSKSSKSRSKSTRHRNGNEHAKSSKQQRTQEDFENLQIEDVKSQGDEKSRREAATKIQSMHRGRASRQKYNRMKQQRDAQANNEREEAAIKIQSIQRSRLAQKEVNRRKAELSVKIAVRDRQDELNDQYKLRIVQLFEKFDRNASGTISAIELKAMVRVMHQLRSDLAMPSNKDFDQILSDLDKDGDAELDQQEFTAWIYRMINRTSNEKMRYAQGSDYKRKLNNFFTAVFGWLQSPRPLGNVQRQINEVRANEQNSITTVDRGGSSTNSSKRVLQNGSGATSVSVATIERREKRRISRRQQLKNLRQLFNKFDHDNDDIISYEEVQSMILSIKKNDDYNYPLTPISKIESVIRIMAPKSSGSLINFIEFERFYINHMSRSKALKQTFARQSNEHKQVAEFVHLMSKWASSPNPPSIKVYKASKKRQISRKAKISKNSSTSTAKITSEDVRRRDENYKATLAARQQKLDNIRQARALELENENRKEMELVQARKEEAERIRQRNKRTMHRRMQQKNLKEANEAATKALQGSLNQKEIHNITEVIGEDVQLDTTNMDTNAILKHIFEIVDTSCTGSIGKKEILRALMFNENISSALHNFEHLRLLLNPKHYEEEFFSMNTSRSNYVTSDEFIKFARKLTRQSIERRVGFVEKSLQDNIYHVMFDEGPLGMGIAPHEGDTVGSEVTVIAPGGQADNQLIKVGDKVIAVGETDITHLNHDEVAQVIQESVRPISITFCRNFVSQTNSSSNESTDSLKVLSNDRSVVPLAPNVEAQDEDVGVNINNSSSILTEEEKRIIKKSTSKPDNEAQKIGYGSHHSTIEKGWSYNPRPKKLDQPMPKINAVVPSSPTHHRSGYKSLEETYYENVQSGSPISTKAEFWSADNLSKGDIMKNNPVLSNAMNGKKVEENAAGMSTMQAQIDQLEKSLEHHKKEYMEMLASQNGAIEQNNGSVASDITKYNEDMENKMTAGFNSLKKSFDEQGEQYEMLLSQLQHPNSSSSETLLRQQHLDHLNQVQNLEMKNALKISEHNENMEKKMKYRFDLLEKSLKQRQDEYTQSLSSQLRQSRNMQDKNMVTQQQLEQIEKLRMMEKEKYDMQREIEIAKARLEMKTELEAIKTSINQMAQLHAKHMQEEKRKALEIVNSEKDKKASHKGEIARYESQLAEQEMLFASLHKKFDKKFESMRNSMEDSLQTTQKLRELEIKLTEAEKSFDKKISIDKREPNELPILRPAYDTNKLPVLPLHKSVANVDNAPIQHSMLQEQARLQAEKIKYEMKAEIEMLKAELKTDSGIEKRFLNFVNQQKELFEKEKRFHQAQQTQQQQQLAMFLKIIGGNQTAVGGSINQKHQVIANLEIQNKTLEAEKRKMELELQRQQYIAEQEKLKERQNFQMQSTELELKHMKETMSRELQRANDSFLKHIEAMKQNELDLKAKYSKVLEEQHTLQERLQQFRAWVCPSCNTINSSTVMRCAACDGVDPRRMKRNSTLTGSVIGLKQSDDLSDKISPLQRRKLKESSVPQLTRTREKSDFEEWLENDDHDIYDESPWRPVSSSNAKRLQRSFKSKNFSGVVQYKAGKPVKKISGSVRP